jgi:hypothetical protein
MKIVDAVNYFIISANILTPKILRVNAGILNRWEPVPVEYNGRGRALIVMCA